MPIYEFECPGCHARLEALVRLGDDGSELRCPECGGDRLERVWSTFAASAGKGSGSAPACGSGFT